MDCKYEVMSFFLPKDKEKSKVEVKEYTNYFTAYKLYKEKLTEMEHRLEQEEAESWFISFCKINTEKVQVDDEGESNYSTVMIIEQKGTI